MDNVVARPIETVTEVPQEQGPHVVDKGPGISQEMPLELYKQENKSPYIDNLLEVDDILPMETRTSIDLIDGYVSNLLNEKGYKPTTESYRAVLETVKKDLGIDKNTSLENTIDRISKYIEAEGLLKKLKDVDEEKILRQLKKSPTASLIQLVMKAVEKQGL